MIDVAYTYEVVEITDEASLSMMEKEGIKEKTVTGIKFNCEHCNQPFNYDNFNLSILLYGVAFLVGPKFCYIGLTCPKCLNTILLKGDSLIKLQQIMTLFRGSNDRHLIPFLRYHSSVLYSPVQIDHLKSYKITTWTCPLSEKSRENFYSMIASYLEEEPDLEQNYLSSYIYQGEPPIGSFASAWWFKPDDIEALVQIENDQHVRVFPRYVHKMSWYERYDFFCWQYRLYHEYLASLKDSAGDTYNILQEYAYQEDTNLKRLLDDNPETIRMETAEYLEQQAQQIAGNDIQAASEFLDLLINFDPVPWDVPGALSDFYKGMWKSPTPFKGASVPDSLEEFNNREYEVAISDAEVKEMADEIRKHVTQTNVQEWAAENHQRFIEDYISLARRPDFSYGLVWDLKCRYLMQLKDIADEEIIQGARYAFFEESPAWTIIFDGEAHRGLKGSGFRYLHFLVQNQREQYDTNFLNELDAKPENNRKFLGDEDLEEMIGDDIHIKTDEKAKRQFESRIKELRDNMSEAENNNDLGALEKASAEYELILDQLKKDFDRKGNPRIFKDDSLKIKSRITQAIQRAINKIKKYDPELAKHFNKALRPINSFHQCYNPDELIDWKFKN